MIDNNGNQPPKYPPGHKPGDGAHQMLAEAIQKIYYDYGLRVDAINVNWLDVSTGDRDDMRVSSVQVESRFRTR